jgi:RNA polymerase sigma factor (sigma-70 family)
VALSSIGRELKEMTDTIDGSPEGAGDWCSSRLASLSGIRVWFAENVLPLEAALVQFSRRNWRDKSEVEDMLQDVYVRVFEAACREIPRSPKQFVFTTAHNLLINRFRQQQVVPIDAVADLETLEIAAEDPTPDRIAMAHEEFRLLQAAIDLLPPRCREAIVLGRVEGLTGREIAQRMGVSEAAVSKHLARGLSALSDTLHRDLNEDRS